MCLIIMILMLKDISSSYASSIVHLQICVIMFGLRLFIFQKAPRNGILHVLLSVVSHESSNTTQKLFLHMCLVSLNSL
jgi:hypothetical protein